MDSNLSDKFFQTNVEAAEPDRIQLRIEALKRKAAISDSIVLVRYPAGIVKRILLINTFLKRVPYLLLQGRLNLDLLKDIKKDLRETAFSSWLTLAKVYPFAFTNDLTEWRFFNDTPEEKNRLIENNKNFCNVILPFTDEIGMLATVVKHLCIVRRRLRMDMNVEVVNTLREVGEKLLADLNSIIERYGIRSLLPERSSSRSS